ncbi:MAG: chemotaxis protein CheW [Syntrophobacteraceae bacterium]
MNGTAGAHIQNLKSFNAAFKGYMDGTIDFYGDQIEAATGYRRQDFQSRKVIWTDLIIPEDRRQAREVFVAALKGDKTYTRQYRILDKAGRTIWIQEWSQIVCSSDGQIDHVTGIIVDITDSKTAELARLACERRTGKYLTFTLAGEAYGIRLVKIREIIEIHPITPVPNAPVSILGVINLRGKVIPVMDLKQRLGLAAQASGDRRCIIVVEVARPEGALLAGLLVDEVSEVLAIRGESIEDTPPTLSRFRTEFILGMAKIEDRVRLLLDTDRVFGDLSLPGVPLSL